MPEFTALRFGSNPLPATRSPKTARLDLPNYVVQIKSVISNRNEHVFAFLTEGTSHTVFGAESAAEFHVPDSGNYSVFLVNEDTARCYPIDLEVIKATPGNDVPVDYLQLGWDVIATEFDIGREKNGLRRLKAKEDDCLAYEVY